MQKSRTSLIYGVLFFVGCGAKLATAGLFKESPRNTEIANSSRFVPKQTLTIPGTESSCPLETIAGRFQVPQEPTHAFQTATLLLLYRTQTMLRQTMNNEPGLLAMGLEMPGASGEATLFCMYWDLRKNDGVIDFYTCRHFIPESTGHLAFIGKYPAGYAFDVYGDARGNITKFLHFMDSDHDGDICDKEFVRLNE